jgi:hypothetical protein
MSKAGPKPTPKPNTVPKKPSRLNSLPLEVHNIIWRFANNDPRTAALGQADVTSLLRCYSRQLCPKWVDKESAKVASNMYCLIFSKNGHTPEGLPTAHINWKIDSIAVSLVCFPRNIPVVSATLADRQYIDLQLWAFDKHDALFKAIRDNIYNNLDVEHREARQIESMGQFNMDWLEPLRNCLANWPPYTHIEIFKFSIGFYKLGKVKLLLDVSSKKDQIFSPAFSGERKNLAEVVNCELMKTSDRLCRITSVIFQDTVKSFMAEETLL